jgi:hypothetical protein
MNFEFSVDSFLTYNLLTIASFRIGVPSILSPRNVHIKPISTHIAHPKNADVIYGRSLKLKEPVAFSDTIGPPCLPDQGDFGDSSSFGAGMECYLSGWGRVGHGENMPQDIYGR